MSIKKALNQLRARIQAIYFYIFFLIPGQLLRTTALATDTTSDDSNPILGPIFDFFRSLWNDLGKLVDGLTGAINNWFSAVWEYKYAGIPVGPVLFVAISVLAIMMIWGFFKLRQFLRTS